VKFVLCRPQPLQPSEAWPPGREQTLQQALAPAREIQASLARPVGPPWRRSAPLHLSLAIRVSLHNPLRSRAISLAAHARRTWQRIGKDCAPLDVPVGLGFQLWTLFDGGLQGVLAANSRRSEIVPMGNAEAAQQAAADPQAGGRHPRTLMQFRSWRSKVRKPESEAHGAASYRRRIPVRAWGDRT